MSVVTIRGQMGSGSPEIGREVTDRLHFDYIDREIIDDVAKRLKCSKEGVAAKEMPPGTFLGRIVEALGRGYGMGFGYAGNAIPYMATGELPLDDTHYLAGLKTVIEVLKRRLHLWSIPAIRPMLNRLPHVSEIYRID